MKTNFKDYLEIKQAQKEIDKIAKQYENKKVVLYGAGLLAGDLIRNYDLSKLNVIGVADIKFKEYAEDKYYEYQKLSPDDLLETDFDLLLITAYDDIKIKNYLKNELFQGEKVNFKIKTLINMNLFEYIKATIKKEI